MSKTKIKLFSVTFVNFVFILNVTTFLACCTNTDSNITQWKDLENDHDSSLLLKPSYLELLVNQFYNADPETEFPIVEGGMGGGGHSPPIQQFFSKTLPSKPMLPPSPLKNEASPSKKQIPPLKREAPFHEMITSKITINNNLESS